jgi:putative ubiquitin-RnfH superfamily antitoxin RatB of RatAB toxin-antitoxin module
MESEPGTQGIRVEVAYAIPTRQILLSLEVLRDEFPDMVLNPEAVGVFSRKVTMEHRLEDGDRVEIYRPLIADPKESRRKRAEAGRTKT